MTMYVYEVSISTVYGELVVPVVSPKELDEDSAFEKACDEARNSIDYSKMAEFLRISS